MNDRQIRRSARLYNGMTQTSSSIIVTAKSSMEYAELCMSMRLARPLFGMSGRHVQQFNEDFARH